MKAEVAGPDAKTQARRRAEFEAEAKAKAEGLRTLGLPDFRTFGLIGQGVGTRTVPRT